MSWLVTTSSISQTFGLRNTVITTFLLDKVGWQLSTSTVVRSSITSMTSLQETFFVEAATGLFTGRFSVFFSGNFVVNQSVIVFHTFDSRVRVNQSAFSLVKSVSV